MVEDLDYLSRSIDDYTGSPIVRAALRLLPLVFVRPVELRHARWSDIDGQLARWTIPAAIMKMRSPHMVPLSRLAIAVIDGLRPLTSDGPYLFPSLRTIRRPISENTLNGALRRLGYSGDEMTSHGLPSMASTRLNEMGRWNPDVIERPLRHHSATWPHVLLTELACSARPEAIRMPTMGYIGQPAGVARQEPGKTVVI